MNKIFKNIREVVHFIGNCGWSLDLSYNVNLPYTAMTWKDGRVVYYPQPLCVPKFRGQNKYYSECNASKFRGNPSYLSLIIEDLRVEEFKNVMHTHPYVKAEIENDLNFDHVALAQHYGLKTNMIDLTNNLSVALFFAVTYCEKGQYFPMSNSSEPGVLYFFPPELEFFDDRFTPVGWQIFPHPSAQRAFGLFLSNKENLNEVEGVQTYLFNHDIDISNSIFRHFNNGKILFPQDQFSDKLSVISETRTFSQITYQNVISQHKLSIQVQSEMNQLIKNKKIDIVKNSIFAFSDDELTEIMKKVETGMIGKNRYATTRLCYTPPDKSYTR